MSMYSEGGHAQWYYVDADGVERGPSSKLEVETFLQDMATTNGVEAALYQYVWSDTLPDWELVQNVPELSQVVCRQSSDSVGIHRGSIPKSYPSSTGDARHDVLVELYNSESEFVGRVKAVVELYSRPLQLRSKIPQEKILAEEDVQLIFSNIETISCLSDKFLVDLSARLERWDSSSLAGDILQSYIPFMKMYSPFASSFSDGLPRLSELLAKYSPFITFNERCLQDPRLSNTTLPDILTETSTRVAAIQTFLHNLQNATPPSHPDHATVTKAVVLIDSVSSHQEQSIKHSKNLKVIRSIEEKFIINPGFTSPGRELLCNGVLTKVCRRFDKQMTFFLFNDMLAYATSVGGWRYTLNRKIPIDASFAVSKVDDTKNTGHFYFQISSSQKSFVVYTANMTSRDNWIQDIQHCISKRMLAMASTGGARDDGRQASIIAPVWQKVSELSACPQCNLEFSLLRQKHHCRVCGSLVCADCSRGRKVLPGQEDKSEQRVCDLCMVKLNNGEEVGPTFSDLGTLYSVDTVAERPEEKTEIPTNGLIWSCDEVKKLLNPSTNKPFVVYVIHVHGHGYDHIFSTRYSQLEDFDSSFRKDFPNVPFKLPGKKLFGSSSTLVIDERRRAFPRYLEGVCGVRALWERVGKFIQAKPEEWKRVAKACDRYIAGETSIRVSDIPLETQKSHIVPAGTAPAGSRSPAVTPSSAPPPAVPPRTYDPSRIASSNSPVYGSTPTPAPVAQPAPIPAARPVPVPKPQPQPTPARAAPAAPASTPAASTPAASSSDSSRSSMDGGMSVSERIQKLMGGKK